MQLQGDKPSTVIFYVLLNFHKRTPRSIAGCSHITVAIHFKSQGISVHCLLLHGILWALRHTCTVPLIIGKSVFACTLCSNTVPIHIYVFRNTESLLKVCLTHIFNLQFSICYKQIKTNVCIKRPTNQIKTQLKT